MRPWLQHTLVLIVSLALLSVIACSNRDSVEDAASSTSTQAAETSTTSTTPSTTSSTTTAAPACSAAELPGVTEPRTNISEAAEATRLAIIDAALVCNFGALAVLAGEGPTGFMSSVQGDDLDVGWAEQEAAGQAPMTTLVHLLRGSMGTVALETVEYRFPSAAGFGDWAGVPEQIRRSLEPLYTEADWPRFEAAGEYNGHTTVISDQGEWLRFTTE